MYVERKEAAKCLKDTDTEKTFKHKVKKRQKDININTAKQEF
jgi:hypothetical protein